MMSGNGMGFMGIFGSPLLIDLQASSRIPECELPAPNDIDPL
jgi:hypothetical protein